VSNDVSLAELQEFIAEFWFHYDEAHFDELSARFADDVHYMSRSDTGACPFEELLSADLHGREATMAWMVDHRNASPYPLRHMALNIFRSGADGDVIRARFYLLVSHITNSVPFVNSTATLNVGVARGPRGLHFTSMESVLDTQESVPLTDAAGSAVAGR
jgi:hypothetical protein